jgi:protein-S-isoprenylcysteine O-methyltransferase Ste14
LRQPVPSRDVRWMNNDRRTLPDVPPPIESTADTAGVIAPPPVIYVAAWLAAAVLHRTAPAAIVPDRRRLRQIAGGVLVAAGTSLSVAVVRRFGKAATPVTPLRASTALVVDGTYRYTRNPDYIGQTLTYLGLSFVLNRAWPVLLLPAVLAAITRGVVEREEQYLTRKFGSSYRAYMTRVPRWI